MEYVFTKYNEIKTGILFDGKRPIEIDCFLDESCIGNIYIGKISNIVKNIQAVFVDISKGESCYFPMEDYGEATPLRTGDRILVQVTKDKIKTKQATVSTRLTLTGKYVIVASKGVIGVSNKIKDEEIRKRLSNCFKEARKELGCIDEMYNNFGGIVRTQAENIDEELIKEEIKALALRLGDIISKSRCLSNFTCLYSAPLGYVDTLAKMNQNSVDIISDLPEIKEVCKDMGIAAFREYIDKYELHKCYQFDSIINKAMNKIAYLKSGAYLVIEPTEAMTVIDVNSGKSIKGNNNEKILEINCEAAVEIARQIKLRNLSGMIIIDFISMKSEQHQKELLKALQNAVSGDPIECNVIDITRLGLVEMTRKKVRKPIHEIFK